MWRKSVNIITLVCVSIGVLGAQGKLQSQYNVTGTVLGHVQDPLQASVPQAKVTLHNEQGGINQEYATANTEDHTFINQTPDTHDVTVTKYGFHAATTRRLILQVKKQESVLVQAR
jgi:hypothetical protein